MWACRRRPSWANNKQFNFQCPRLGQPPNTNTKNKKYFPGGGFGSKGGNKTFAIYSLMHATCVRLQHQIAAMKRSSIRPPGAGVRMGMGVGPPDSWTIGHSGVEAPICRIKFHSAVAICHSQIKYSRRDSPVPETGRLWEPSAKEASLSAPAQTLFNATCVDFSTQKQKKSETKTKPADEAVKMKTIPEKEKPWQVCGPFGIRVWWLSLTWPEETNWARAMAVAESRCYPESLGQLGDGKHTAQIWNRNIKVIHLIYNIL